MNMQMLIRVKKHDSETLKISGVPKELDLLPSVMTYGSTGQMFSIIIAHYWIYDSWPQTPVLDQNSPVLVHFVLNSNINRIQH